MPIYLNTDNSDFIQYANDDILVDKSMLISYTNSIFGAEEAFMCVSRLRRSGKTVAISMLNAYYSKGCDSRDLFKDLKIYNDPSFENHLNKHNVIYIDMASLYTKIKDKSTVLNKLKEYIFADLNKVFPNVLSNQKTIATAINKINSELKERFIFLIDEWDVIYRESDDMKLKNEYTDLLRSLFEGSVCSSCLDLVYMTGILPIIRTKSNFGLNNFDEYNMIEPFPLEEFMGFTEDEVKSLCDKYNMSFDEMKVWYGGYTLSDFGDIYNPMSIVQAITRKRCREYWTRTCSTEALSTYMNYGNGVLKERVASLLIGDKIDVSTSLFENDMTDVKSIDDALTVLIHLGYLAYDSNEKVCYIPNYEMKKEFLSAIRMLDWDEFTYLIECSKILIERTFKHDLDFINQTLDKNYEILSCIFNENKEDVPGAVVYLSYYVLIDRYIIQKEADCTTDRCGLICIPQCKDPAIIIELVVDSKPSVAIAQIMANNYLNALKGYHGDVYLVGINYDSKMLKHDSMIEVVTI